MLHSIKKLIGDKGRQLIVPIVLMSLDAIGSLVMYLMLYFTVVHAIMNGVLYANELELLNVNNNFDSIFMICFSCVVIIISVLICKNSLSEEA